MFNVYRRRKNVKEAEKEEEKETNIFVEVNIAVLVWVIPTKKEHLLCLKKNKICNNNKKLNKIKTLIKKQTFLSR